MGTSFKTALQRYVDGLGEDEKRLHQHTTTEAITAEFQLLQTSQVFRGRTHRFFQALEPVIQFVSRYASAVDTIVQYDVSPSAIIWGTMKVVLMVRQDSAFHRCSKFY